jgi:hypothetical protein
MGYDSGLTYRSSTQEWIRGGGLVARTMPLQIAEQLNDRYFNNFKEFRETFWQLVEADSAVGAGWSPANRARMSRGWAPFVPEQFAIGGRAKFELEHIREIQDFGIQMVYYLPNIRVVSPLAHEYKFDFYAPLRP